MRVPVDAVVPGSRLARPVYGVMGQVLLREGVALTPAFIKRLQELGVLEVYIQGGAPDGEDPISAETRCRAFQMLAQFAADPGRKVPVREVIGKIMDDILARKGVVESIGSISTYDGYTFTHSVDVCALAIGIGITLGLSRQELLDLGTGSLLHDIGKLKIPRNILNKPGRLSPEEYEVIKMHPRLGYETVLKNADVNPVAARTVLEHHERWDGSGYPEGKAGNDIHLFAAICGVADTYSAMTSNRVYRKAVPFHESYEMLLAAGGLWFDFKVIRAFARCIVPYPKGALVELTDGRAAQVVRSNPDHPYVPIVRLLHSGGMLGEEINLQQSKLGIRGALATETTRSLLTCTEERSAPVA